MSASKKPGTFFVPGILYGGGHFLAAYTAIFTYQG